MTKKRKACGTITTGDLEVLVAEAKHALVANQRHSLWENNIADSYDYGFFAAKGAPLERIDFEEEGKTAGTNTSTTNKGALLSSIAGDVDFFFFSHSSNH